MRVFKLPHAAKNQGKKQTMGIVILLQSTLIKLT